MTQSQDPRPVTPNLTPSTLAGIEEAIEAFLKKQVMPWSAREMAEAIADHLSAARRGLDADGGRPKYTSAVGEAASAYLKEKGGDVVRLPGGFFWCEVFEAMLDAALIPTERGESGR